MADREIIKTGMIELMAMRVESMKSSLDNEDPSEFLLSRESYIEARGIAKQFVDIGHYEKDFAKLCEEYSRKHNGVAI